MKSLSLYVVVMAHGLTQIGMSCLDPGWRFGLFTVHLGADFGLFLWVLGPERRAKFALKRQEWLPPYK